MKGEPSWVGSDVPPGTSERTQVRCHEVPLRGSRSGPRGSPRTSNARTEGGKCRVARVEFRRKRLVLTPEDAIAFDDEGDFQTVAQPERGIFLLGHAGTN